MEKMTRDEAINELKCAIDLIKQDGKDWLDERDIPLLRMAIEALEQPTADVIPIEYHDRCMELEIKKRANMVEVVRCKDCVYYENFLCGRFSAYGDSVEEPEYDYCSYGERREDDKG